MANVPDDAVSRRIEHIVQRHSQLDDAYVHELRTQLAETGRKLWVLDITHDLGIPSYVALSHSQENGEDFIEFGSGSHFDRRIALLRSLTELSQFLTIGTMGGGGARGDQSKLDGVTPLTTLRSKVSV